MHIYAIKQHRIWRRISPAEGANMLILCTMAQKLKLRRWGYFQKRSTATVNDRSLRLLRALETSSHVATLNDRLDFVFTSAVHCLLPQCHCSPSKGLAASAKLCRTLSVCAIRRLFHRGRGSAVRTAEDWRQ